MKSDLRNQKREKRMPKHQCIYCLEEKDESEFNREHVISRFMGTYENAPVLNNFQVCEKCNSYFCEHIENVVSFDSLEGLLRTENLHRSMNTRRAIGRTRLKVRGDNDIFKGLTLYISSAPGSINNIQMEIAPAIGIVVDESKGHYEYFLLDNIPYCNDTIAERIYKSKRPFIVFGYDEAEVNKALIDHGYDLSKAKYAGNLTLSQITSENEIVTQIRCTVDNLLIRLSLKNLFNFLCYSYGKECATKPVFNNYRTFIRYGKLSAPIKMFISNGGLREFPGLKENCHTIGFAWSAIESQIYLCGFVSWFNTITYTFALFPVPTGTVNCLPLLKCIICDNNTRIINEAEYLTVFDWPNNTTRIGFCDTNLRPIKRKRGDDNAN